MCGAGPLARFGDGQHFSVFEYLGPRGLGGKVGGFFGDHAWILRDAQGPF